MGEDIHIAILCEVELSPEEIQPTIVAFPRYKIFSHEVDRSRVVRCIILVRDDVDALPLDVGMPDIPAVWLRLPKYHMVVGGLYRQFSCDGERGLTLEREQLKDFSDMMAAAISIRPSDELCLAGDFNLDAVRVNDASYSRGSLLRDWLLQVEAASLRYHPTPPTFRSYGIHDGAHHTSTIDHVYTTGHLAATVAVLSQALSDHFPVRAKLSIQKRGTFRPERLPRVQVRNFQGADYSAICQDLENLGFGTWPAPPPGLSPDVFLDDFLAALHPVIDKHIPLQTIKVRRDTPDLFLQPDTRRALRTRDAARASASKSYRRLRNLCVRLVCRDKIQSAAQVLRRAPDRSAAAWGIARGLLHPKKKLPLLSDDPSSLASATRLNDYYIAKVEALRQGIIKPAAASPGTAACASTAASASSPAGAPTVDRRPFSLRPVSMRAVSRALFQMSHTRAVGVDSIPTVFWRKTSRVLAPAVCHLVNASILTGVVPALFKSAIVHPVLKRHKDRHLPASYRPVAILAALSKVLERLVAEQLEAHLKEFSILPDQQHGFRRGRSTLTALAAATHSWASLLAPRSEGGSGAKCLAIAAFDYTAAFDTLSVDTVMGAISSLGCEDATAEWFRSYMTGGQQQVVWNEATSPVQEVTYGVRQGSILGPLIYIVTTRAFPAALGSQCVAYADDTNAWAAGDAESAVATLSGKSDGLVSHSAKLELVLNGDKTQLILVGPRTTKPHLLHVGGCTVPPGSTLEVLGLKLDGNLSPVPALEKLRGTLARLAGTASRTRALLPPCVHLPMMRAMINGSTCSLAVALLSVRTSDTAPPASQLARHVQVALNDTARGMLGTRRADKICVGDLMDRAGLISLNRAAFRSAALLAWDSMNSEVHPLHSAMLSFTPDSRTRAAACGDLLPMPPRMAATSLIVSNMILVWNFLPSLRSAKSKYAARSVIARALRLIPVI